jgi:hypothetical protein
VIVGKSVEAKERRLVPEVIEDFFIQAGPLCGLPAGEVRGKAGFYRVGRVPKGLGSIINLTLF